MLSHCQASAFGLRQLQEAAEPRAQVVEGQSCAEGGKLLLVSGPRRDAHPRRLFPLIPPQGRRGIWVTLRGGGESESHFTAVRRSTSHRRVGGRFRGGDGVVRASVDDAHTQQEADVGAVASAARWYVPEPSAAKTQRTCSKNCRLRRRAKQAKSAARGGPRRTRAPMSASASANTGRESARKRAAPGRRCHGPACRRNCTGLCEEILRRWDKRSACHRPACGAGCGAMC